MTSGTGKRSLTFVELILVILIIGVLIGISLPNLRRNYNSFQLKAFSSRLQSLVSYLRERSIVEAKVIFLNIDTEQGSCWANIEGREQKLKSFSIPGDLTVDTDEGVIAFFPDGSIQKATINIQSKDSQSVILTTRGVFGGIKAATE